MKIRFPFLFFPAFIFYVDSLKPNVGGLTNAFVIRILKKYENTDEGILQHELRHVEMFYKHWMLSSLLLILGAYLYYPSYIVSSEGVYNTYNILNAFLFGIGTYSILYLFSKKFKFLEECKCYQVQCRYYDDDRSDLFAGYVADYYDTGRSKQEALDKIRDGDYGQHKRALKQFSQ